MNKASVSLKNLALSIGWKLVNEDKGFSTYEYEVHISRYENDSYIIRILDEPNNLEVYEILLALIKVLPYRLRKKISKLTFKFKAEDFANFAEVAVFTVDEYKKATEYSKLMEYGKLLGVKIEEKFPFEYKLKKQKRAEILSYIEINLPIEQAPIVGKIKKIEYKMAYVKNNKQKEIEE